MDHAHAHGHDHHDEGNHFVTYTTYIQIWLTLCVLTGLTVVAATLDLGQTSNVVLAMFIATVKAGLVISVFMHVKYDWGFLRAMMFVLFITIAGIIPLYLSDFAWR